MAIREDLYDPNQLVGDAEVPYLSNPIVTGNVRRHDPDNQHAYPYVPSLTGKRLVLEISRSPGNPTPLTLTIDFSLSGETDSFKKAIEEINTVGGADLQAFDAGGYLRLISQHAGFDNYLLVKGGSTNTAAALLGLMISPLPGSISYAGEMASTPPGPEQANPQGTQLVGKDEDLTSSVINRAILGMQQYTNRLLREFDRELVGIKEYSGITLIDGGTWGWGSYFALDDSTTRIPLKEFMGGSLMDLVNVLGSNGEEIVPIAAAGEIGASVWDGSKVYVTDVCYGGPPWTGSLFGSWNPPSGGDGGTIYDTGVYQKTKHAAVAITVIHGNLLVCDTATFLTKLVQPGDTLLVQNATNTYPFDPNGEYVVERVLSETQVQVRAKTQFEDKVWSTSPTPTRPNAEGNPSAYGEVFVPIGFFLPVSRLRFKTNVADMSALDLKIRLMVGKRLREIAASAQSRALANNSNPVGRMFRNHVDELEGAPDGTFLHNATALKVTTPPAWYGGDTITATRAQAYLDGLINSLKDATSAGHSGADLIGSAGITLTGPQALGNNSIRNQVGYLLSYYNAHVTAAADKHAAADITAAATSNNWNDGSNPGSGSVQSVLSQIVGQLANNASAADGAVKIGFYQITGGTKTVATGSVRSAITDLLNHVNKHLDAVSGWRHYAVAVDATAYSTVWYSFGGGTVQSYCNFLEDCLSSLKDDIGTRITNHVNGSAEKHADTAITSVNRTNFNGSYVHDCLDDIDGKAGFKAATNYWTAANYFRQINTQGYDITSFGGAISSAGGQINAENGNFRSTYNPGYSSGYTNQMVGKSMVKAWAQCWTPGNSGGSGGVISDGFNVSSCSAVNIHTLQINFASRMKVYASGSNHYGICAVMTPLMFGSPDIPWIPVIWDVDYQAGDWAYWIQVRFMAPTYPSGGDNNDGWWKCYGSPGHNIFFYLSIPGGRQV